jgi:hypothetical protein
LSIFFFLVLYTYFSSNRNLIIVFRKYKIINWKADNNNNQKFNINKDFLLKICQKIKENKCKKNNNQIENDNKINIVKMLRINRERVN